MSGTATASTTVGSASVAPGTPRACGKSSKGFAQRGFTKSRGAMESGGGLPKCTSARAPERSTASARLSPSRSLVQPVTQAKRSPDSSACTCSITHCRRVRSPRAPRRPWRSFRISSAASRSARSAAMRESRSLAAAMFTARLPVSQSAMGWQRPLAATVSRAAVSMSPLPPTTIA